MTKTQYRFINVRLPEHVQEKLSRIHSEWGEWNHTEPSQRQMMIKMIMDYRI